MSIQTSTVTPAKACIDLAPVFQDPYLEDATPARTAAERRHVARLQQAARAACGDCPVTRQCLYAAVVKHDVAGFVAGTTEAERLRIRGLLDWRVEPENLDDVAGITAAGRQIDPLTVARMRAAAPDESLETLAQRLGCSLSTVKRHLRKVRNGVVTDLAPVPPSMEQVLHAARLVLDPRSRIARAA